MVKGELTVSIDFEDFSQYLKTYAGLSKEHNIVFGVPRISYELEEVEIDIFTSDGSWSYMDDLFKNSKVGKQLEQEELFQNADPVRIRKVITDLCLARVGVQISYDDEKCREEIVDTINEAIKELGRLLPLTDTEDINQ